MIEISDKKDVAHSIYKEALRLLIESDIPFLVGGAFALNIHTGVIRDTKDLDIFCKTSDYIKILKIFEENGFRIEQTDVRWLAKAFKGDYYIDFIYNTVNNICTVDESWFENSVNGEQWGISCKYLSAEELFWCKIYVQNRERYDGADLNHIILSKGKEMDWKRILSRLEQHWQLLLAQFLQFQFVYPSDIDMVPKWLFDELLQRSKDQYDLPLPQVKICRGPLIDQIQYEADIVEGKYKIITMKTI